jgi:general secretion pathway protein J
VGGFADGIRARAAHQGRRVGGFTLLEVLVAIGIFAMLSVMAYGSLASVIDSRDRVQVERQFWQTLDLAFQRLDDDLAQARVRRGRDLDGGVLPALRGQPTDTRALGPPSLELTRGGVLVWGDGLRSDLQRVAYRLADGTLTRLTWPVLDRAPPVLPLESPMLTGVEEFRVRFMNANGGWVDIWPMPGSNEEIPKGVEIALTLKARGAYTRRFLVHG